jgi:hypothetical protein
VLIILAKSASLLLDNDFSHVPLDLLLNAPYKDSGMSGIIADRILRLEQTSAA